MPDFGWGKEPSKNAQILSTAFGVAQSLIPGLNLFGGGVEVPRTAAPALPPADTSRSGGADNQTLLIGGGLAAMLALVLIIVLTRK